MMSTLAVQEFDHSSPRYQCVRGQKIGWRKHCSILFNSAPSMACYQLAKILILAGLRFDCDIQIFFQVGVNFMLEASECPNGLYQHRQASDITTNEENKRLQECRLLNTIDKPLEFLI